MKKIRTGFGRYDSGEGGFAASRRSPENHGKNSVLLNGLANQGPLPHHMRLADKLSQVARAQSFGQWSVGVGCFLSVIVKYVHVKFLRNLRVRLRRTGTAALQDLSAALWFKPFVDFASESSFFPHSAFRLPASNRLSLSQAELLEAAGRSSNEVLLKRRFFTPDPFSVCLAPSFFLPVAAKSA
jgi:hypothetical protein